jgi:hypothetical protein
MIPYPGIARPVEFGYLSLINQSALIALMIQCQVKS